MKKFVNDPLKYVPDMLKGIALANPDTLRYVPEYNLIMRADAPRDDKVSIIQGSGSGHEPAHVLTVGKGMLDGACPGDVFAAPPMDYVYETTKLLASPKGVLLLVNNYTGDKMAFDMAQELSLADGVNVRTLFIDDDVAVQDSTYTVGRRGVAGNVFIFKATGAAADLMMSIDEVERVARHANDRTFTIGVALSSCSLPQTRRPSFDLPAGEMEIGMGIHGEPGIRRGPLRTANEVVDEIMDAILAEMNAPAGARVAVLVNSLGSTPLMELYILNKRVAERLAEAGLTVHKTLVGPYCTSLEMAGASITVMHLDDELQRLMDHPCDCVMFRHG